MGVCAVACAAVAAAIAKPAVPNKDAAAARVKRRVMFTEAFFRA